MHIGRPMMRHAFPLLFLLIKGVGRGVNSDPPGRDNNPTVLTANFPLLVTPGVGFHAQPWSSFGGPCSFRVRIPKGFGCLVGGLVAVPHQGRLIPSLFPPLVARKKKSEQTCSKKQRDTPIYTGGTP